MTTWVDEARAGLAAGDDPRRQGSDHGGRGVGGAGVDRTDDLAAKEHPGAVIDLLGDLLADDDHGGAIRSRALLEGRLQANRLRGRQVLNPALPALGGVAGLGGDGGNLLGQGVVGHDRVEGEMELVGVEFFRTASKVLLHERLNLGLHLAKLEGEDAVLLLGRLPLRQDHRLELCGVVGQVGANVSVYRIP